MFWMSAAAGPAEPGTRQAQEVTVDAVARQARREHWQGVVGTWRDSGLGKAAFCREHGLKVWQFDYWVQRFAGPDAGGNGAGLFARVEADTERVPERPRDKRGLFSAERAGGSGVRLRVAGLELELDPGFDESTLRRFLRAVRPPC
jgi:hypothetical protein